jgi:hypothetical protein
MKASTENPSETDPLIGGIGFLVNGSNRNGTESVFGKPPLISMNSPTTTDFAEF